MITLLPPQLNINQAVDTLRPRQYAKLRSDKTIILKLGADEMNWDTKLSLPLFLSPSSCRRRKLLPYTD